jgi:hypothetical protein
LPPIRTLKNSEIFFINTSYLWSALVLDFGHTQKDKNKLANDGKPNNR